MYAGLLNKIKKILKLLIPPILPVLLKKLITQPEWEYIPAGWGAAKDIKGWNVPGVLENYKKGWQEFAAGLHLSQPSGGGVKATFLSNKAFASFTYAIMLGARNKSKIRFLDWGGNRALLPD